MKYLLSIAACLAIGAVTAPANAATTADQTPVSLIASPQSGSPSGEFQLARRGADDPAGDYRGGAARRGRGGPGRGGHDDGRNHA